MTGVTGQHAALAVALAGARRVRLDAAIASERLTKVGRGAWEGRQADLWQERMHRLTARAAALVDACVRACEEAWAAQTGQGPPPNPPPGLPPSQPPGSSPGSSPAVPARLPSHEIG